MQDKDTDEEPSDTEDDATDDEVERAAAEHRRKVAEEKAVAQAKLDKERYGGEPARGNMFRNRSLAYLIEQGE